MGYFYVETKSYEIQYESRNGGVRLAERSKGIFRAVVLGRSSVFWLMNSMEALIKRDYLRDFWSTFQHGNTAYIMEQQKNNHKRFM